MKKERIETIITIIAGMIFVILLTNQLTGRRRASSPPSKASPGVEGPQPAAVEVEEEERVREAREIETIEFAWGRDPFQLKEVAVKGPADLVLNGIIWDKAKPYAIINDKIVRRGDRIGDNVVVLEIRRNSVVLKDGAEQITLEMWK